MGLWSALLFMVLVAISQLPSGNASCGYRNFTCSNGECISARDKCDGRTHCSDGSDEVNIVCDKAPSMRMQVGDVVLLRAQYTEGHGAVWFHLCDTRECSTLLVSGNSSDGSLQHTRCENCNARGDYGNYHKVSPEGWKTFPEGLLVFVAERRSRELALWLPGHEDKAITVPVGTGSDLLRVRPFYWTSDMPVEFRNDWKTSLSSVMDTRKTLCLNGGRTLQGKCICQPGFSGHLCEKACGPDRFGEDCEQSCSSRLTTASEGCSGVRFSARGGETCAAGFQGPRCDQVCDERRYGAGCSEACGKCGGAGLCDPYTGKCLAGCLPGYHGATCKDEFTYLVGAPNVTTSTSHSVEGNVTLQGNTAGSGLVKYIQVQYREPLDEDWKTGALVEVKDQGDTVPFTVDGLRADSDVELRAVLLDERARGRPNVPQVRVRTGKGVLSDVAAASDDGGNVKTSWQLSGWTSPVVVEYECESVMGCAERCHHSFGLVKVPTGVKQVVLPGLLPAARYRLTVHAGLQAVSTTFFTALRAPNVMVFSAEAVWVTNTSVLVKWAVDKGICVETGAPMQGYRWQLIQNDGVVQRTGSTMTPLLSLEKLKPGSNYSLQVAVANAIGVSEWTTVNFKTEHSPPLAPLELTAYRWNTTTLSLRWRPPALPGGKLVKYSVSLDGVQPEEVSPDSRCAAWPDMLCHVAHRPRRGRLSGTHSVEVSATNDLVVSDGDAARIKVAAVDKKPDAVSGLEADPTVNSVLLRWRLPDRLNGDMHLFIVSVTRVGLEDSSDDLSYPDVIRKPAEQELPLYESVVGQLQPNATYKATVQCVGSGGSSDDASVMFTTPSDFKERPSDNVLDATLAE